MADDQVYQTNFNNVIITNQYDVDNRLTNCRSINGYQTSYAYSPTGLKTNMTDAGGTTSYSYDGLDELTNKVVSWNGGPTVALNYGYDLLGSVTNLWSSTVNGVNLIYNYDLLGRVTNVLANGNAAAGYGYDELGNLQSLRYGDGVTNLYQYDSLNRLTNQVWRAGGTALAGFGYALGVTGNRTALAETVNGTSRTYNWAYDYLYRLTGETVNGLGTVGYHYDAVGNRTNRTSTISGINNQANSFTANDWLGSDTYDTNGNTTASGTGAYQYDVMNHLTNANSGSVVITYDGDGDRVSKKAGGVTTYYLLDDKNPSGYVQVLEEWTSTGTPALSRVYNYGLALISQRQASSGTVSYYGTDGHGSTRFLLDGSGGITDTYTYDAYGVLIANTGTTPNSYLYCGQQFDSDLGLYYNRARYLNSNTGRFWTMDTYEGDNEDPLTLHKYVYGEGNPVDNDDPLGLYSQGEGYAMERLIGADYAEAHPMAEVTYGQWARIGENPRLKPDILNKTDKTYADIKPLSLAGINGGIEQLETYDESLKSLKYKREQWPGNSIAPLRIVFYNWNPYFYFNVDGIIFYTRIDPAALFIPVSISGAKSLASYSTKALARGAATTLQDAVLVETAGGVGAVGAAEGADIGVGEGAAALTAL